LPYVRAIEGSELGDSKATTGSVLIHTTKERIFLKNGKRLITFEGERFKTNEGQIQNPHEISSKISMNIKQAQQTFMMTSYDDVTISGIEKWFLKNP